MNSAGGVDTLEVNKTLQLSVLKNGQPYTDVNYSVDPNNLGNITVDGLFTATADGGVTIKAVDKIKAENVATKQLVITPVVVPPVAPIATTDLDFTWDGVETKVVGTLAFDKSDNVDLNEAKKLKLTLEKEVGGNQQYEVGVASVVDLVVNVDGTVPDKVVKVVTLDSLNRDDGTPLDIRLQEGQSDFIEPPAPVVNKAKFNANATLLKKVNTDYSAYTYDVDASVDMTDIANEVTVADGKFINLPFESEGNKVLNARLLSGTLAGNTLSITDSKQHFGNKMESFKADSVYVADSTRNNKIVDIDKIEYETNIINNPALKDGVVNINSVYNTANNQVDVTGTITFADFAGLELDQVTRVSIDYSDGTLASQKQVVIIPCTVQNGVITLNGSGFVSADVKITKTEGITALLKADNSEVYGYSLDKGTMNFSTVNPAAKAIVDGTLTLVRVTDLSDNGQYTYVTDLTVNADAIANNGVNLDDIKFIRLTYEGKDGTTGTIFGPIDSRVGNNILVKSRMSATAELASLTDAKHELLGATMNVLVSEGQVVNGTINIPEVQLVEIMASYTGTFNSTTKEVTINATYQGVDLDALGAENVNIVVVGQDEVADILSLQGAVTLDFGDLTATVTGTSNNFDITKILGTPSFNKTIDGDIKDFDGYWIIQQANNIDIIQ